MQAYFLRTLYPKALGGLPGLGTPIEAASRARKAAPTPRAQAKSAIGAYLALSGTTGFLTNLGGWLTMPVTLPANLAGVAVLQLHLGQTIAALAGHDPSATPIRDRVIACLLGDGTAEATRTEAEETVDRVGVKLAERALRTLAGQVARTTGRAAVGTAKWLAERRLKRLVTRGIPLVGGAIAAASDAYSTRTVANALLASFFNDGGGDGRADDSAPQPPTVVDLIPTETQVAETNVTIRLLEKGLQVVSLPKALNTIMNWQRATDREDRPDLQPISEGLGALHELLLGDDRDGVAIGEAMADLGKQTCDASGSAEEPLQGPLDRLGKLLQHAGNALAENAREAAERAAEEADDDDS
jgi:hypothetical protein